MTRAECMTLKKVLTRIKDPDGHVRECIAIVEKQLAQYDSRIGQIRESYEDDRSIW